MNNQFDNLTKSLAQSVTRRAALKKFGVGLAGMALACFGLANKAAALTCPEKCSAKCMKLHPDPQDHAQYLGCVQACFFKQCYKGF